jgi:hypothetical protein
MSIAHIPKGILYKIKKKCFSFLWTGKHEKEGLPLIKWKKVANLKEAGGWGLTNIHIFSLAPADKSLWRLVYNEGLWGKIMKSKYLRRISMENLFRQERKSAQGGFSVWKDLVRAFPLMENGQHGRLAKGTNSE